MTDTIDDIFTDGEQIKELCGAAICGIIQLHKRYEFVDKRALSILRKDLVSLKAFSEKYPSSAWLKAKILDVDDYAKESLLPKVYEQIYTS
jgi:hypothetical protein